MGHEGTREKDDSRILDSVAGTMQLSHHMGDKITAGVDLL